MAQKLFLAYLVLICGITSCTKEKKNLRAGQEVYVANCITCHGENGEGIAGFYPSLVRPSGIVPAQTTRTLELIRHGSGFENGMKPISLTREEIADVVNYIQNSWGNEAPMITMTDVDTAH